jgi:hypothetical protein
MQCVNVNENVEITAAIVTVIAAAAEIVNVINL